MARRTLTLAFIGLGHVAGAVWQELDARAAGWAREFGIRLRVQGYASRRLGIRAATPAQPSPALADAPRLPALAPGPVDATAIERWIAQRPADVLVELSALAPDDGQPAVHYLRAALAAGMHCVTANKGPQAFAYRELAATAQARRLGYRFSASVMDGAPVFALAAGLPGSRLVGFAGILNSTSNFILSALEDGQPLDAALRAAQAAGFTESDPAHDLDGSDAAMKTAVLANVLFDAEIRPAQVQRQGIGGVDAELVAKNRQQGRVIRLIARGDRDTGRYSVAPEALAITHPYAAVRGTSCALTLRFDGFGDLMLVEPEPGLRQTAYGVIGDLLAIAQGRRQAAGRAE